ncbi:MAG: SRPBCC family protein [Sedimentitalea sp.]
MLRKTSAQPASRQGFWHDSPGGAPYQSLLVDRTHQQQSNARVKAALIVGITVVVGFCIAQFTSKTTTTEIEINAAPEAVWAVLNDTKSYPDWNPFMRRIDGVFVVGDQISVVLQPGEITPQAFTPTVLVVSKNREIRWLGRLVMPGIFDGELYFKREESTDGTTLLRRGETFSGMVVYPLMALIGTDAPNGFEAMNTALKAESENQS